MIITTIGLNEIVTNSNYSLCLGISLKSNVLLEKFPLGVFDDMPSLKSLQIVEPTQVVGKNLSLNLENLEQLRIVGSSNHNPILPAHFLHTS